MSPLCPPGRGSAHPSFSTEGQQIDVQKYLRVICLTGEKFLCSDVKLRIPNRLRNLTDISYHPSASCGILYVRTSEGKCCKVSICHPRMSCCVTERKQWTLFPASSLCNACFVRRSLFLVALKTPFQTAVLSVTHVMLFTNLNELLKRIEEQRKVNWEQKRGEELWLGTILEMRRAGK
jgi:hypothetical protein